MIILLTTTIRQSSWKPDNPKPRMVILEISEISYFLCDSTSTIEFQKMPTQLPHVLITFAYRLITSFCIWFCILEVKGTFVGAMTRRILWRFGSKFLGPFGFPGRNPYSWNSPAFFGLWLCLRNWSVSLWIRLRFDFYEWNGFIGRYLRCVLLEQYLLRDMGVEFGEPGG